VCSFSSNLPGTPAPPFVINGRRTVEHRRRIVLGTIVSCSNQCTHRTALSTGCAIVPLACAVVSNNVRNVTFISVDKKNAQLKAFVLMCAAA